MGATAKGFTIIEVMLFLAMSSLFLIIVFNLIGDTQRNNQFTLGMEETGRIVGDLSTDLRNGFSGGAELSCNAIASPNPAGPFFSFSEDPNAAGRNEDCIFLGKVIDFGQPPSRDYTVYTVVGSRDATGFGDSRATVVPQLTRTGSLPSEVEFIGSQNTNPFGGVYQVGVFHRVGSTGAGLSLLTPIAFEGTGVDPVNDPASYDESSILVSDNVSITYCFATEDRERVAALNYGFYERQLATEIDYEKPACKARNGAS